MTHLVRQIHNSSCFLHLSRLDICRNYCEHGCMAREYQLECLGHFSCHLDYDDDCSSYSPGYDDAPQAPRYIFQSRDSLGTLWHHVKKTLSRPYSIWEYSNNHTSLYGVYCWSYNREDIQKISRRYANKAAWVSDVDYTPWLFLEVNDLNAKAR